MTACGRGYLLSCCPVVQPAGSLWRSQKSAVSSEPRYVEQYQLACSIRTMSAMHFHNVNDRYHADVRNKNLINSVMRPASVTSAPGCAT
jgi:hypothetical protein